MITALALIAAEPSTKTWETGEGVTLTWSRDANQYRITGDVTRLSRDNVITAGRIAAENAPPRVRKPRAVQGAKIP